MTIIHDTQQFPQLQQGMHQFIRRSRKASKILPDTQKMLQISQPYCSTMYYTLRMPSQYTHLRYQQSINTFLTKLKYTAAHYRLAYLTPNHVLSLNRLFIIHNHPFSNYVKHQTYNNPQDYTAYMHPKIISSANNQQIQEQCLQFPHMIFKTIRANKIVVQYKNQQKEEVEEEMEGHRAHMFQHCMNHLQGKLVLDYQISKGRFHFNRDIAEYFPKSQFLFKQYSMRLRDFKGKNPSTVSQQQEKAFLQIQNDYLKRIQLMYPQQLKALNQHIKKTL